MSDAPTRSSRRLWLGALVLIFTCPCLALMGLGFDDAPPDDADLLAPAPAIPEPENAYRELCRLVKSLPEDDDASAALCDRLARLLWDRRLQSPVPLKSPDLEFPIGDALAEWLEARCEDRIARDRGREALPFALTALLLGVRRQKDPRSREQWTGGLRARERGGKELERALARAELGDAALARLDERLGVLQELDRRDGLAVARRTEYRLEVELQGFPPRDLASLIDRLNVEAPIGEALAGTALEGFVYKPNRLRAWWAEAFRRKIAGLDNSDLEARFLGLNRFEAALSGNYALWEASHNAPTGLRMAGASDEDLQAQARLDLLCLRVVVAIRRFQLARGRAPTSLSELCPRLLKNIPKDLDGEAIRYLPDRSLIYSIGWDKEDNAASGNDRLHSFARARGG